MAEFGFRTFCIGPAFGVLLSYFVAFTGVVLSVVLSVAPHRILRIDWCSSHIHYGYLEGGIGRRWGVSIYTLHRYIWWRKHGKLIDDLRAQTN